MSVSQNFTDIRPTLNLNFARSKTLDPRITFERASIGTYVGADGLIKTAAADEARFDHDPLTGESLGLLIEEQRTNYYTTSETMTLGRLIQSSQWTWTSFTEGGPQGGGYIRWERIGTTASPEWNYAISYNNTGLSIGDKFVVTFYARCPNGTLDSIRISNPDQEAEVFNIDSQWKKFTKVFTYGIQSGLTFFRVNRAHTPTYVIGTTYDIACLQIEKYEFPTSYIPTSGSQFTRQPDNASITGTNFSSWYNQNEGAFVLNFHKKWSEPWGYFRRPFRVKNDDSTNRISVGVTNGGGNTQIYASVVTGSVQQIDGYQFFTPTETNSVAVAIANNDYSAFANGTSYASDTSVTVPTVDTAVFDPTNLSIARLAYYPQRLTDSQLQNLTK